MARFRMASASQKFHDIRISTYLSGLKSVASQSRQIVCEPITSDLGAVAGLVGIEGGVVSGVINLESSGVEAVGLETTP
jgi:hypothetical protein